MGRDWPSTCAGSAPCCNRTAQDYRELKRDGTIRSKGAVWPVLKVALGNYRSWILALTYGYSFGVELTFDNVLAEYLYDQVGWRLAVGNYSRSGHVRSIHAGRRRKPPFKPSRPFRISAIRPQRVLPLLPRCSSASASPRPAPWPRSLGS